MTDLVLMIPPAIIEIDNYKLSPGVATDSNKKIFDTFPPGWGKGGVNGTLDMANFTLDDSITTVLTLNGARQQLVSAGTNHIEFSPAEDVSGLVGDMIVAVGTDEYPANIVKRLANELVVEDYTNVQAHTPSIVDNNLVISATSDLSNAGYFTDGYGPGTENIRWITMRIVGSGTTTNWQVRRDQVNGSADGNYGDISSSDPDGYYTFALETTEADVSPNTTSFIYLWASGVGDIEISELYIGYDEGVPTWTYKGLGTLAGDSQCAAAGIPDSCVFIQKAFATTNHFDGWDGTAHSLEADIPGGEYHTQAGLVAAGITDAFLCGSTTGSNTSSKECKSYNGTAWTAENSLSTVAYSTDRGAAGSTTDCFSHVYDSAPTSGNNAIYNGSTWSTVADATTMDANGASCGATSSDVFLHGDTSGAGGESESESFNGTVFAQVATGLSRRQKPILMGTGIGAVHLFGGWDNNGVADYTPWTSEIWDGSTWATHALIHPYGSLGAGFDSQSTSSGFTWAGQHRNDTSAYGHNQHWELG